MRRRVERICLALLGFTLPAFSDTLPIPVPTRIQAVVSDAVRGSRLEADLGSKTAAALVLVIGWHESSWRPDVEKCSIRGRVGELGLWQEKKNWPGLCAGGASAQARRAVWRLGEVCRGSVHERLRCYGGMRLEEREKQVDQMLADQ